MNNLQHAKILIASGDLLRTNILQHSLDCVGYATCSTQRGKNVIELVRTENPDLLMMDWKLPDLSGMAITWILRAGAADSRLRIILMGMDMSEEDRLLSLEAGADLCLVESFHAGVYRAWVRALLRRVPDRQVNVKSAA